VEHYTGKGIEQETVTAIDGTWRVHPAVSVDRSLWSRELPTLKKLQRFSRSYIRCSTDGQGTNGVETLSNISIAWVGRTNVTDDRQTDGRRHIANVNVHVR